MGWWIACGVLLVMWILPLGIRVGYNSTGLTLCVIAGPLKIKIFPLNKKKKPGKKSEKENKHPDAAKGEAKQTPKTEPEEPSKQEMGGSLKRFLPLVKLALEFLGDFRKKIRLDNLYLRLTLACDDPCDLAVNYGRAWAAVGNLLPNLERVFVIRKRDIQVACDFTAEEPLVVAHGDITITFGRLLTLAVHYGVRALIEFLVIKRKGGIEK